MFKIIEDLEVTEELQKDFLNLNISLHFLKDRKERFIKYLNEMESFKLVEGFAKVVDRGHKNGLEIHAVTDDGFIWIWNKSKHSLITVICPRVGQLKRLNSNVPTWLIEKTTANREKLKNFI